MKLSPRLIEEAVDRALAEDLGLGDATTEAIVPPGLRARGSIVARKKGVLAGIEVMAAAFLRVDPGLQVDLLLADGAKLEPGSVAARVEGEAASILKAERTALNFLQRLSGIATLTSCYVEAVAGLPVRIVDTRKTTPGLRLLEKYAVVAGGGHNHRINLADGILIKDNHLAALAGEGLTLTEAVARAMQNAPHTLNVEVEVDSTEQAEEALAAGAHILLLDNMSVEDMRRVMDIARGRALIEASGGVTLERVRAIAETGVDLISVGALTHSAPALDIALDFETV